MTDTNVERRLTDALDHHASAVIARPDLGRVIADAEGQPVRTPLVMDRRKTMRRIASLAAAAVVVAVGLVATVYIRANQHDEAQPVLASDAEGPELVDGMGRWTALPAGPPDAASGFTHGSPLSDGRILFWGANASWSPGDTQAAVDGLEDRPAPRASSVAIAVYSPVDNTWTSVDTDVLVPMRLPGTNAFKVAGDRLLVQGPGLDGANRVAVYDAANDTWTTSTVPGSTWEMFDGVAWDGETAVLVRLHPGMGDDATTGASVDIRPSGLAPKVWRWTLARDRWATGEAPPLTPRGFSGWAFDGERLAVVGGVDAEELGSMTGAQSSGAVYDVDADTWSMLPDAPWPAKHPELAWDGDRLLYAGGTGGATVNSQTVVHRHAAWSQATGWQDLPTPNDEVENDFGPLTVRLTDPLDGAGFDHPGAAIPATNHGMSIGSQEAGMLFVDGAWETVPVGDPMTLRNGNWLLAASPTVAGAVDRFEVAVRAAADDWVTVAPAPFSDLWRPALVLVGDHLYVVGTQREAVWQDIEPVSEGWVLDLSG